MRSERRTVRLLALPTALAAVVLPTLPATSVTTGQQYDAARAATCAGLPATIVGTSRPDELKGTKGRDVVVALGGDDVIDTGVGRDVVCAGDGFDHVRTRGGRDLVLGGAGDDYVDLGAGRDLAEGQAGVDSLFGKAGEDHLRGGPGTGLTTEALVGGAGDDVLRGGPGLDTTQYFDSPRGVRVDLRAGRARRQGNDVLVDIEGVVGSNFDDVIIGDDRGNGLFGQAGDDVIRGGGSGTLEDGTLDVLSGDDGDDQLEGGGGEDLVVFGRTPVPVSVDLAAGSAVGHGTDELIDVEAVQGSRLDDTLVGGPADDVLIGNLGDDAIDGGAGEDTAFFADVVGPVQVDLRDGTVAGEASGNDSLTGIEDVVGTRKGDTLRGDDADNHLDGGDGNDLLVGFEGVDLLDGNAGLDECVDLAAELVNCEDVGPARQAGSGSGHRSRRTSNRCGGWAIASCAATSWISRVPALMVASSTANTDAAVAATASAGEPLVRRWAR
jgi:Ca2+-binding RTX toxin-like protein